MQDIAAQKLDRCSECRDLVFRSMSETIGGCVADLADRFEIGVDEVRACVTLAAVQLAIHNFTEDLDLPRFERDELRSGINNLLVDARTRAVAQKRT